MTDEPNFYEPYDDQGWGPILRALVRVALTFGLGKRREKDWDGVQITRFLFSSLLMAGLLIGFVLIWIVPVGDVDAGIAGLLAIVGLGGVIGAAWARRRPLDTTDPQALAQTFRASFFLGFALSEVPLLVGFAVSMIEDALWPYLVVLPFYLVAMGITAPGKRNLKRRQEAITSAGSPLSLGTVLARSSSVRERA